MHDRGDFRTAKYITVLLAVRGGFLRTDDKRSQYPAVFENSGREQPSDTCAT
ncbi:MAG TPA: hypothetical protein VK629_15855 [Steroidobacteraceae bacterium]|nr:hypothetical protein [Steroidobacteraceae bacterium]